MTDRKHTTQDQKRHQGRGGRGREGCRGRGRGGRRGRRGRRGADRRGRRAAHADELAVVTRERDEYLDHLRRLKAEWDNYRKRVQRDNEELRLRAAETVVESLLPVMDNMSRAIEAGDKHEEGQLLAGLTLVAGQLRGTLAGHGLEEIGVEPGTTFDPEYHEAIVAQPSEDHPEGTVTQVLERGYLLHGKLLRPAKVIVAS